MDADNSAIEADRDEAVAAASGPAVALSVGERLKTSWRAIVENALAAAVAHPTAELSERPALVKQVRKATKTGRALVHLLSEVMPPETNSGAERTLAEASLLLSQVRDRDAMFDTINGLLEGRLDARIEQARLLLHSIAAPPAVGDDQAAFESALVRRAAALISFASELIGSAEFDQLTPRTVGDSMAQLWRKARRRAKRAWHVRWADADGVSAENEASHAARKACARLIHQLNLLEPDLNKSLRRFRQRLHRASSALGADRDLSLLVERIGLHRGKLGPTFAHAVLSICTHRQAGHAHQAGVALAKAMTVRPRTLGRRIRKRYAAGE